MMMDDGGDRMLWMHGCRLGTGQLASRECREDPLYRQIGNAGMLECQNARMPVLECQSAVSGMLECQGMPPPVKPENTNINYFNI